MLPLDHLLLELQHQLLQSYQSQLAYHFPSWMNSSKLCSFWPLLHLLQEEHPIRFVAKACNPAGMSSPWSLDTCNTLWIESTTCLGILVVLDLDARATALLLITAIKLAVDLSSFKPTTDVTWYCYTHCHILSYHSQCQRLWFRSSKQLTICSGFLPCWKMLPIPSNDTCMKIKSKLVWNRLEITSGHRHESPIRSN